jgi:hypothetical protein
VANKRIGWLALLIGLVILVLVVSAWILGPRLNWDGAVARKVQVRVLDARTGAGIPGASVTIAWTSDNSSRTKDPAMLGQPISTHATDAGGRCEWVQYFGAGGTSSLLGRSGTFGFDSFELSSASGYEPRTEQLGKLVGGSSRPISDESPVEAEIRLKPLN